MTAKQSKFIELLHDKSASVDEIAKVMEWKDKKYLHYYASTFRNYWLLSVPVGDEWHYSLLKRNEANKHFIHLTPRQRFVVNQFMLNNYVVDFKDEQKVFGGANIKTMGDSIKGYKLCSIRLYGAVRHVYKLIPDSKIDLLFS